MSALLSALLAVSSLASQPTELRLVSPSEMDEDLRACGLQHFSIYYDEELQSQVVEIRDMQVSDYELRCAFRAQDSTAYLLFWPEPVLAHYSAIREEEWSPRIRARAEAYFAARPELGSLPLREPGQSEIDYLQALERFCGPDAAGIISMEYGAPTFSHDWLASRPISEIAGALECMMNASALVGLEIGIIGNENVRQDESQPPD